MTPELNNSFDDISKTLDDLAEWLRGYGSTGDLEWFRGASSDAIAELTKLRGLTLNVDGPGGRTSVRNVTLPSLDVATEVAGCLMKISQYVQNTVLDRIEERALRDSVGRFLGSLYVDVIWPLHTRYPALVPDETKPR
jgi:hypothetical protein